jgi:hypothetical protein
MLARPPHATPQFTATLPIEIITSVPEIVAGASHLVIGLDVLAAWAISATHHIIAAIRGGLFFETGSLADVWGFYLDFIQ